MCTLLLPGAVGVVAFALSVGLDHFSLACCKSDSSRREGCITTGQDIRADIDERHDVNRLSEPFHIQIVHNNKNNSNMSITNGELLQQRT